MSRRLGELAEIGKVYDIRQPLAGWVVIDSMVHTAIATHSPDGTVQHVT